MRICIDLDGTICEIRRDDQKYSDLQPIKGAKEKIDQLKAQGHEIIINTARNMKTQERNVGKVLKNVGKVTLDWLEKNEIYYDEIFFGKPDAHLTIDDRSHRFTSWQEIDNDLVNNLAKAK